MQLEAPPAAHPRHHLLRSAPKHWLDDERLTKPSQLARFTGRQRHRLSRLKGGAGGVADDTTPQVLALSSAAQLPIHASLEQVRPSRAAAARPRRLQPYVASLQPRAPGGCNPT